MWADLAVAFVTLAAVTASIALTVGQASLAGPVRDAFISSNTLATAARRGFARSILISIAAVWVAAGIYLAFRRRAGAPSLRSFANLVSPLIVAFAIPSLLAQRLWFNHPLQHLAYLLVVVLVFERLARNALASVPAWMTRVAAFLPAGLRAKIPIVLVLLSATAYGIFAGYCTVIEHWRFATGGYDLGIYDNLLANLLAGKPFRSPVCTPYMSYLSNHAEFGIFFMAPIYALFPRAETLLIAQAVFLSFAAVPLYLFGATQIPRASAALVAVAYLLYAPMHGANFYDFHWMPMAIPVWLTLFYGLARRKLSIVIPAVCFVLPLREETGVMLAFLGTFLVLSNYWPRLGTVFCFVGVAWFGLMKFVVIPLSGTWWFENMFASLIAPGEAGYGSVIKTLLINPAYLWSTLATEAKLIYALHIFAPLALLPLRKPLLAFVASPGFFFTLLTTDYAPTLSIRFQYTSHWIPWIFGSSVLSLMLLGRGSAGPIRRRAALGALLLGVFCHSWVYGAVLQHELFIGGFEKVGYGMTKSEKWRYEGFKRIAAAIPKGASVAASENIVAHVSNRKDAYTLKITYGHADYLLVNGSGFGGEDKSQVQRAIDNDDYGLVESGHNFYLFKRDYKSPGTKAAFAELHLKSDD